MQYVFSRDELFINLNLPGRKVVRRVKWRPSEVEGSVFEFRSAITTRADVKASSRRLFEKLILPIEDVLSKHAVKEVVLSLDGRLRYVPFSALWDGKGFLIERFSFTIFEELLDSPKRKVMPAPRVAAFGVSKGFAGFAPLPAVPAELLSIVGGPDGGVYPGVVRLDEQFTFEAFKGAISEKYPIVHVATHFRFSPGTEENSYLLLGGGERLSIKDLKTLKFDGIDLITYSGCQTGMGGGADESGKEVAGLSYVTMKNGARSVISSLWSVSDRSTAELMVKVYRNKARLGVRRASAMQQAMLEMLRSKAFEHPFYWAGFQLHGL